MRADPEFDDFVAAHSTALLRTAYLLTGDRGHAEDLLQTALLRTLRRWSVARQEPAVYIRRVLVNLSRDRIRGLVRRPREAPLPADPASLPGSGMTGHAELVGERHRVADALARLPVRQRQVVVLRFFEDLSVAQTADLLGFSEGTVKSYTSRAPPPGRRHAQRCGGQFGISCCGGRYRDSHDANWSAGIGRA